MTNRAHAPQGPVGGHSSATPHPPFRAGGDNPVESPGEAAASSSGWTSTAFALALLALFVGAVLGVMALGGVVLHATSPARHVDQFYVLHKVPALVGLLAMSVVCLLVPGLSNHQRRGPATRRASSSTSECNVITLAKTRRDPTPLPLGREGVPMP